MFSYAIEHRGKMAGDSIFTSNPMSLASYLFYAWMYNGKALLFCGYR